MNSTSASTSGDQIGIDLPAGAIVGEYRIEKKLKQGGMGTVYEAVHQLINKRAAVKVLKPELCENDEALHRFVQEARAVNQINHPNIVDVFGFGTTDDGLSFLAMELLVGDTLGERMARGPLPRRDACAILSEVTHALEAAHACGVVHRDLKPENVFLASYRGQEVVKLLDFGIAKLTGGGGMPGPVEVTQPGTLIGTPKYIAPEQARGLALDGSADVYALGVIAFELLAGRAPFTSGDAIELIAKHITLTPPAPSDFAPRLPAVADELIGAMLEKVPADRPSLARIRELLGELAVAEDARPDAVIARRQATTIVTALQPPTDATATSAAIAATVDAAETTAFVRERDRDRRWWIALPLSLAMIAVGVRIAVAIADRENDVDAPVAAAVEPVPPTPVVTPVVTPLPDPAPAPAPAPADPGIEIDRKPASSTPTHVVHRPRAIPHVAKAVEPKPEAKAAETKPPEVKPPEPAIEPKPAEPAKPTTTVDDGLRDPFHSK